MPASCPSSGSTASSAPRRRVRTATGSTRSRCRRFPAIRTPAAPPFSRRRMSHHFDYPTDETLDISDAYCFAGPGDLHGPRTVFGMNTSPFGAPTWNPAGYYELKIDTNGDYVEDITFRATFPIGSDGTQPVEIAELTGAVATRRHARGKIITPRTCPVGEVV